MTSTTLSSKDFKTLFKWAFKRNRAIMIIFSVFLGIGIILDLYLMAIDISSDNDAIAPVTIAVFECMAAFFVYISALKTFSFLHNKRSVDMFGALPTNRTTMFVSHLLAGVSAIAAPFTIASVVVLGVTAFSGEYFGDCVFMIFSTLIMICAAYTFTALVAYCCGTVVDTAIVTFISNCIWVAVIAIYFGLMSEMIPGFDMESSVDTPLLTAIAPYAFSVMNIYFYEDTNTSTVIASIAWDILFTAGAFFLTLYVANKRKAESSQNGFAFPWLPMIIKAGASVAAGSFIGFIAAETAYRGFTNMFVFAFWYVVIAFVAFFVLHLIFSRGLKGKFLPSAIVFGCTTVAALGVLFALSTGLGIDTYVPNPDMIKSIEFDYVEYKDPENIRTITEIHQVIADGIRKANDYPYYIGEEPYEEYDDYDYMYDTNAVDANDVIIEKSDSRGGYYEAEKKSYDLVNSAAFDFSYNKKVGFKTVRSYYISTYNVYTYYTYDLQKLEDLLQKLYNSEEYKATRYPEIWYEENREGFEITEADLDYYIRFNNDYGDSEYTSVGYATLPKDEKFMSGLYEALKADILADENFPNSHYYDYDFGNQYIELKISYVDTKQRGSRTYYYNAYDSIRVNIKEDYRNTQNYLEKNGIQKIQRDMSSSYYLENETYYRDDYICFGYDGDISYLYSFLDYVAPSWAYNACAAIDGVDFEEWHKEHYSDYYSELRAEAIKLYDEYSSNDKYFDPDYTNDYMEEYDDFGDYFQLEDAIIDQLGVFTIEYVKGTPNDSDTASDNSNNSDIDSNTDKNKETDSDTQSDVESPADTDSSDNTSSTSSKADNSSKNASAA